MALKSPARSESNAQDAPISAVAGSDGKSRAGGRLSMSDVCDDVKEAMPLSDGEHDPSEPVDLHTIFPIEGKYYSEVDRAEMMEMPEIQREQILAERAHELLKRNQDRDLRRLYQVRQREKEEADSAAKRRRKLSSEPSEVERHNVDRPSGKSNQHLENYKKMREMRLEKRARVKERSVGPRSPSKESPGSSKDADGESDLDWNESKKRRTSQYEPPASLKYYERARVGRSNFGKVCFYPGFAEAITGCFCRVSVGTDPETRQNIYRMAQIKGFREGKPYRLDEPSGKPFATDQWATLAVGESEKDWPFVSCSDGKFSEEEFRRWLKTCEEEGVELPTQSFLVNKVNHINALLAHKWTDTEITEKLRRQNRHKLTDIDPGHDGSPKLMSSNSLNSQTPSFANAKSGPLMSGLTQAERLAQLNMANRKANSEEIRRVLIRERRRELAAREAAAARAAAGKDLQKPGQEATSGSSNAGNEKKGFGSADTDSPRPFQSVKTQIGGFPTTSRMKMDDEIIEELDFGIDMDIGILPGKVD